jgi:flagellar basal body-associated protein FliL
MMGQNSFSGTDSTTVNEQEPVNPVMVEQNIPLNKEPNKKRIQPKTIILIIIGVLLGAGITTAAFLLFTNPATEEPNLNDVIETKSPENDGTKTNKEVISEYDEVINSETDENDKLDLILDKVDYYILNDDYDSALSELKTINIDSLGSSNKQIVYNHFSTIYEGKGDSEQATHYSQLANQAYNQAYEERLNGTEESEEEDEETQVEDNSTEDEEQE